MIIMQDGCLIQNRKNICNGKSKFSAFSNLFYKSCGLWASSFILIKLNVIQLNDLTEVVKSCVHILSVNWICTPILQLIIQ